MTLTAILGGAILVGVDAAAQTPAAPQAAVPPPPQATAPAPAIAQPSAAVSPPATSPSAVLRTRALAATCAACHGTDGHAVPGAGMPRLAGLAKNDIVQDMRSFRDGTRPATVMQQIAKGFSDEQTDALAAYFSGIQ